MWPFSTVTEPKGWSSLQRARRIVRAPAPLRIDRPERDVREDDDGRALRQAREILLQPVELLLAEHAEAAFLDRGDIHQADEMHAFLVEAEPAGAVRALAEALEILRAVVAQDVVLAGHEEDLLGFAVLEHLLEIVELLGLRELREIAGVQDEIRRLRQRIDPRDGLAEGRGDIGIRRLVKADVAVADLHEVERRRAAGSPRRWRCLPACAS